MGGKRKSPNDAAIANKSSKTMGPWVTKIINEMMPEPEKLTQYLMYRLR